MDNDIKKILNEHTDVFGFVPVIDYIKKQNELAGKKLDHSFLDSYKTIITFGISYPKETIKHQGKGYGILSRYSYGIDYHIVLRDKINIIENSLSNLGIKSKGSVDISSVDERLAAYLSGIGFIGKNQFVINNDYGSFIYLGTVLVDCDLKTKRFELDDCGSCTKCITACPTGALDNGFDQALCLSQITQEKKTLSLGEISHIKSMIYGCDICQNVCPKNKGINSVFRKEFEPIGIENVDIKWLLEASNKEYMQVYGSNASSWKGPLIIRRNALAILMNQNAREYIPLIKASLVKYKDVSWYNETANKILQYFESE